MECGAYLLLVLDVQNNSPNPGYLTWKKTQQPRYVIEPETCKYSSILRGYNKWYIAKLNLKKETTNPNEMKIKDELVLQGMTQAAADEIEYNTMGDFQTIDKNTHGYYIVKWIGNPYTLQEKYKCHAFDPYQPCRPD